MGVLPCDICTVLTGGFPLLGSKQFGFVVFESTRSMPPGSVVLECCLNALTITGCLERSIVLRRRQNLLKARRLSARVFYPESTLIRCDSAGQHSLCSKTDM